MQASRTRLFAFTASLVVATAIAILSPQRAAACGDDENCACGKAAATEGQAATKDGAAAPSCGDHAAADCPMQKEGGCGNHASGDCSCPKAGDGKACACEGSGCGCAGSDGKGGSCGCGKGGGSEKEEGGKPGAANLRATIDPQTGELVQPSPDTVAGDAVPAAAAAAGQVKPAPVAMPDGGVIVAYPSDRAPNVVATIDGSGTAHASCGE